jgi:hypothetical protein
MLFAAIIMVLLNYGSMIHHGALAITIVALATLLNSTSGKAEFKLRRISKTSSTL